MLLLLLLPIAVIVAAVIAVDAVIAHESFEFKFHAGILFIESGPELGNSSSFRVFSGTWTSQILTVPRSRRLDLFSGSASASASASASVRLLTKLGFLIVSVWVGQEGLRRKLGPIR